MNSDERRKLKQFYYSLNGQQQILEEGSKKFILDTSLNPLEEELHLLNKEFPSLIQPFNKHRYFSHYEVIGNSHIVTYHLTPIRAYLAAVLGRLEVLMEQQPVGEGIKQAIRSTADFMSRKWWIGVAGVVAIISLILTVILVSNYGKQQVSTEIPPTQQEPSQVPPTQPTQQTMYEEKDITDIDLDNSVLTKLYNQASELALAKYDDAKLSGLSIMVTPYQQSSHLYSIYFDFYSLWAVRKCTYASYDGKTVEVPSIGADVPIDSNLDKVPFEELPWIKNPDWLYSIKKASQKVGPLPPVDATYYHIFKSGYMEDWVLIFSDGVSGKRYHFSWDGKGDPTLQ